MRICKHKTIKQCYKRSNVCLFAFTISWKSLRVPDINSLFCIHMTAQPTSCLSLSRQRMSLEWAGRQRITLHTVGKCIPHMCVLQSSRMQLWKVGAEKYNLHSDYEYYKHVRGGTTRVEAVIGLWSSAARSSLTRGREFQDWESRAPFLR